MAVQARGDGGGGADGGHGPENDRPDDPGEDGDGDHGPAPLIAEALPFVDAQASAEHEDAAEQAGADEREPERAAGEWAAAVDADGDEDEAGLADEEDGHGADEEMKAAFA